MSKKIVSRGTIVTPSVPPQAGFYESLVFLDDNGYFMETQNYVTAMARAGLRCVNSRSGASPIYAVHSHADGLFNDGVSALGRDLLQILAYEGFEGEVRDADEGVVYILSCGNLLTHPYSPDEDESFVQTVSIPMVA
jgi:hypothetical protein